jgi:hypothetical protein
MAFAARMKSLTNTAQDSFRQEVDAKIAAYTVEVLEKLQHQCEEKAKSGLAKHVFSQHRSVADLWKNGVHGTEVTAAQSVQASLEAHVAVLGFSSVQVFTQGKYMHTGWQWGSLNTSQGSHDQTYCFKIAVSWADAVNTESANTSTRHEATGAALQCIVCFETRPVVALVPCGHTVCHVCARTLSNQPCPSCRSPVATSTRGLFLG